MSVLNRIQRSNAWMTTGVYIFLDQNGVTRHLHEVQHDGPYRVSEGGTLATVGKVWAHKPPGEDDTWTGEAANGARVYGRTRMEVVGKIADAMYPWKPPVHN